LGDTAVCNLLPGYPRRSEYGITASYFKGIKSRMAEWQFLAFQSYLSESGIFLPVMNPFRL
jgi:hypothetical protein